MPVPSVSIIICTRNRAASLRATLESISKADVPVGWNVEVLVVDNGSIDETAQVVTEVTMTGMSLRYALETTPGQCRARNRGLAETQGKVVLFTDDDVRVPVNWIEGMCSRIMSGATDAVAGGVRLAGYLERPWLMGEIRGWVACTDGLIDPAKPSRMVGANMAFSRHVLERVPGFDVELGPGALGFYDETLFAEQLLQAGYHIAGALDVVVEHHPDSSRFTAPGFVDIARTLGRAAAYPFHHWRHGRVRLLRVKLAYFGLMVALHRFAAFSRNSRRQGPSLRHLLSEYHFHFHRQYARERRKPQKYERFGLCKVL